MIRKIMMKKYKVILRGMGIFATGILSFKSEPTLNEIEEETALYLNEKLLKVEEDSFHREDRYILTYEEVVA
tara:strand:- start:1054 stop:1269 length:216 start_codon:yes stop_codon:yes gene_type:complete